MILVASGKVWGKVWSMGKGLESIGSIGERFESIWKLINIDLEWIWVDRVDWGSI